jgi:SAM-dependent methyltransferase
LLDGVKLKKILKRKMLKINLGSGFRKLEGYINIDKSEKAYADYILDLEKGLLPLSDNSAEEILATHILEHIQNIIPLMNECFRVLKDGGRMIIEVPQNEGTWADPTHVRAFSKLSFRYYCGYPFSEIYGITAKFKLISQDFIDNPDGGVLRVILEK